MARRCCSRTNFDRTSKSHSQRSSLATWQFTTVLQPAPNAANVVQQQHSLAALLLRSQVANQDDEASNPTKANWDRFLVLMGKCVYLMIARYNSFANITLNVSEHA
jgi:hypothetical protein